MNSRPLPLLAGALAALLAATALSACSGPQRPASVFAAEDLQPVDPSYETGFAYEHGLGVPQDYRKAMKHYFAAARLRNDVRAMNNLGVLVARGHGHGQDSGEARSWFERAQKLGSSAAAFNLGLMSESGFGVAWSSKSDAAAWYRIAADQGNANAEYRLARMLEKGDGVAASPAEAQRLLRLAAASGNAAAAQRLAEINGGKWTEASVSQAKAIDLMVEETCSCGSGIPLASAQDEVEALRADARSGSASAQYNLAVRYQSGQGMVRDTFEAARLYTLAARQGYGPAQYELGLMFIAGEAVVRDPVAAHMWLNLAARSKGAVAADARAKLAALEATMTTDQVNLAQAMAAEFMARS
jgi:TPR repeat protein